MAERLRFLPAGNDALLVELGDLETTLTLLGALQNDRPEGVMDLVPAARTLLVSFDRLITSRAALVQAISSIDFSFRSTRQGNTFEIPVAYDGEDLNDVADLLGWSVEDLVRRHTEATYTVAFTGFAPGFAYMTSDDTTLDVPRRKNPRVRIPAGSVALGGKFSGIYPTDSPGGWQILGHTPLKMWDMSRSRAALLEPGDRVYFRDMAKGSTASPPPMQFQSATPPSMSNTCGGLLVTRADRPALFQDLGRPGRAGQGISESGALDRTALVEANLCVGNPRGSAAIEITYGGFAFKTDRPVTLAVTGAPAPATIRSPEGKIVGAPLGQPFALDTGDELTLEFPPEGTRSYLAIRGGFAVDRLLGSAATDTLAKVGPAPIVKGDVLMPANQPVSAVDPARPQPMKLPKEGDTVTLDVAFGPRTDWFTEKSLFTFLAQEWQVTAESNRVGVRLAGAEPLERAVTSELLSEGTLLGAIQVPHNGQPVLFLADHPLTGGYPVIGSIARHHLDLAGQIPIGGKIRFNTVSAFDQFIRDTDR
ncbi:putative allophanate hydrolase protein [Mesorhizobium sp. ORS 3324]|nr:putative allophanate hydrolase protein [Mesorhizobium sp. ORS 3324]